MLRHRRSHHARRLREALDASDNVRQARTFDDVPLRNGYQTKYMGTYFTDTPTAAAFTVDSWNNYDTVNF